ncbi:hypothetical protein BX661DRAFT_177742, partial [Kickxella alabastrina]|uniref:uncharacterized protein n=1 Tax=Kickxella alabastrina TaxID=61397 RepID=UPI002220CFEF
IKHHLATATATATAADPEALARASIQATLAGRSSAVAARRLGDIALTAAALKGAVPAYASSSDAQGEPQQAAIPEDHILSLHSYVEQNKKAPHKKSVHSGRDQLNFRVSLLDRKFSATNRKSRSASLPCPKPAMPASAATGDPAQPSAPRFSDHAVAGILRPHARNNSSSNNNRTRSFYDSPLLVQALIQSGPSSPDSQLPQWPVNAAHTAELGSAAVENLAERALFSQLLGDGAALTSPDIGTARRQSIASSVVQSEPPLFDLEVDTGENGVPDSVLRAYLAGDLTAVERFFEHIMLITVPSSIYDGEVSEDGDWLYGLEGPPPEIIAQRNAAAAKLNRLEQNINESREMPGMMDVSAEASRTIVSSVNLPEAPSMSTAHNSARVSDSQIAQAAGSLLDKVPSQMSMLSAQNTRAPPKGSQQVHQGRAFPLAGRDTGDYASDEDIVVGNKVRKIAVPRSLLPRAQRLNPQVDGQNGHSGSRQESMELVSSPAVSTDIATQQWRSNASTSITNSQPLQPAGLAFGHSNTPVPLQASAVRFSPSIVTPASASALQALDVVQPPASYAETASCLSPGRMPEFNRSRSRQQHSEVSHRKPIPKPTIDPKKREKMMLMARLRVLETMVQKSAIEESRLQPPPELRRPQLVDDMESMASIYSSSVVVDYGINQREPNRSAIHQHPHADDSRVFFNETSAQGYENGRAEVLYKLRRGSQVRALYPLRASILNRQFSAPGQGNESVSEYYHRSNNASGDRSAEAIGIDVADQGVSSNRPHVCNMPVLSARSLVATFSKASRFQRTNKILI